MEYIDRFKRMNSINGVTDKEFYTNIAKDNLEQYLESVPTSIEFTLNDNLTKYIGSMVTGHGEKQGEKNLIVPLSVPGKLGDYIYYNSNIWIIITVVDIFSKNKYKLTECNRDISFISRIDNKTIKTLPIALVNWTLYSNGLDEIKYITIQDSKRNMIIQNNDETSQFKVGDRFMIKRKQVFRITHIDDFTLDGVLQITMEQTDSQDNDRKDLNIADYNIEEEVIIPPIGNLIIVGDDTILRNKEKTYNLAMDNGTSVIDGQWSWTIEPSNMAYIKEVLNNHETVILSSRDTLGVIKLKATLGNYSAEKQIEIENYW